MIDVRLLRTELERVKTAIARRGRGTDEVDEAVRLDAEVRRLLAVVEAARARVKQLSIEVRDAKRADPERADALVADSRAVGEEVKSAEHALHAAEAALRDLLLVLPNLPNDAVPEGAGEQDNPVLRTVGYDAATYERHQRVPHWDIGAELGIIDAERAVKISGSMFTMYRGAGATFVRALCQWFLDSACDAFEEIRPPSLVLSESLTATGQLPKFGDEAYHLERDDLWTIPTAEVPLTSLARDEIIDEADLPMRFMAYTPCFRREAGAAGRDTRGILRTHEFDKVELLAYTTPAQAEAMLFEILDRAERLLPQLGLPYRALEICTGDLGQQHHRSIDLEVYAPGTDAWLEVSSVSWLSDYQARRANIRYRPSSGDGMRHLHTLNGSALAVPRLMAALLETHRQADGSVRVPDPLLPYMRGARSLTRR